MREQHDSISVTAPFEVRCRKERSQTWISVIGELDLVGSDLLDQCLWEAQSRDGDVVLDLRGLEFIDSAGLHTVLAARLRATRWRRRLDVLCGSGQVARMVSISGFERLVAPVDRARRPSASGRAVA